MQPTNRYKAYLPGDIIIEDSIFKNVFQAAMYALQDQEYYYDQEKNTALIEEARTGRQICVCCGFCDDRRLPALTLHLFCSYHDSVYKIRSIAYAE